MFGIPAIFVLPSIWLRRGCGIGYDVDHGFWVMRKAFSWSGEFAQKEEVEKRPNGGSICTKKILNHVYSGSHAARTQSSTANLCQTAKTYPISSVESIIMKKAMGAIP